MMRLESGIRFKSHATLPLAKPAVLIISENEAEIRCSQTKFLALHYDVTIVSTFMDVLNVTQQVFDLVMLSTHIKSFGINIVLLLFKNLKEIDVLKPLLFLVSNMDSLSDEQTMRVLLKQPSVDGMMTLNY